ncbi:hypothetical protein FNF31_00436 [Cafeteria roenbergensis]|nr:hypothetical protein FNF31_00436 [Cafeteria roenbergensis]
MADEGSPVVLHLYDLSQGMAARMSMPLLGKQIDYIPHTGIVVFGYEYFFGGGIQKLRPELVPAHFGLAPCKAIPLGKTPMDQETFDAFVAGIQSRYTPATYNLLKHNCNHFTDECANFLLGSGIPSEIRDLPEVFLSTPLGQSLAPMIQQMTDQMSTNMDPFAAGADLTAAASVAKPGAAAPPAAAPAPAAAAAAAASAPASSSAASAGASSDAIEAVFRGKGEPVTSTFIAAVEPFRRLIVSVSKTLSGAEGSPASPLTPDQEALLASGCLSLQAQFGRIDDAAERASAAEATASMLAGGRWAAFHALCSTILRTWPPRARPASLFLVRCAMLRGDGAAYFAEEARGGVMGLRSCIGCAATWLAEDQLSPAASTAAAGVLQNAGGSEGAAAALASRALCGTVTGAAFHLLRKSDGAALLRQSAAAVLHNLALCVDVEPQESGEMPDDATAILLGLTEQLAAGEADDVVLGLEARALGWLVKRGGSMAGALAGSMDAAASIAAMQAKGGWSAATQAALAACRALL